MLFSHSPVSTSMPQIWCGLQLQYVKSYSNFVSANWSIPFLTRQLRPVAQLIHHVVTSENWIPGTLLYWATLIMTFNCVVVFQPCQLECYETATSTKCCRLPSIGGYIRSAKQRETTVLTTTEQLLLNPRHLIPLLLNFLCSLCCMYNNRQELWFLNSVKLCTRMQESLDTKLRRCALFEVLFFVDPMHYHCTSALRVPLTRHSSVFLRLTIQNQLFAQTSTTWSNQNHHVPT